MPKKSRREEQMLGMFELAGYELNKPDESAQVETTTGLEEVTSSGQPKDLIELLKEALGNPPTEPGQWIRVKDIPRFISENLNIPEELDDFNSQTPETVTLDDGLKGDFKNRKKVLPSGLKPGDKEWTKAAEVPEGKMIQAADGTVWEKEADNSWTLYGDTDKGGYYDIDAEQFGPMKEVKSLRSRVL